MNLIQVKDKIKEFFKESRRMPSYAELADLIGVKSKETVFRIVNKLINQDFISKDEKGRLIPKRLNDQLRLLGTVEAGFPSPAEEELLDTMTLDEYLIRNRDATFMLKVEGESMKDAGIKSGDMVLVERNRRPSEGDIVIAEVDGEWTMKYYRKNASKVYLQPANNKFKNIYPEDELNIAAVVTGVVRRYK